MFDSTNGLTPLMLDLCAGLGGASQAMRVRGMFE